MTSFQSDKFCIQECAILFSCQTHHVVGLSRAASPVQHNYTHLLCKVSSRCRSAKHYLQHVCVYLAPASRKQSDSLVWPSWPIRCSWASRISNDHLQASNTKPQPNTDQGCFGCGSRAAVLLESRGFPRIAQWSCHCDKHQPQCELDSAGSCSKFD